MCPKQWEAKTCHQSSQGDQERRPRKERMADKRAISIKSYIQSCPETYSSGLGRQTRNRQFQVQETRGSLGKTLFPFEVTLESAAIPASAPGSHVMQGSKRKILLGGRDHVPSEGPCKSQGPGTSPPLQCTPS